MREDQRRIARATVPPKGNTHWLLPITPEFAELLAMVTEQSRRGFVFKPLGVPRTRTRIGKRVSSIGKAAGVVTDHREKRNDEGETELVKVFATAHDLRRSFGFRWSRRIMPTIRRELMRHESIETTMKYYVGVNAEATADELWRAIENQPGTTSGTQTASTEEAVSKTT